MKNDNLTQVQFSRLPGKNGDIARINLHRPDALNALNYSMTLQIFEYLESCDKDEGIKAVLITGEGERAFSSGGDLRYLFGLIEDSRYAEAERFFGQEYRLNQLIAEYSKPYIAFMDGITMGGGVGLSVHGSFRIGSERLVMAMPETAIGLFPDVGASYFLSRCPDEIGIYLGLTGQRINAADAKAIELIDYIIPSYRFEDVMASLQQNDWSSAQELAEILLGFVTESESSSLLSAQDRIQACFSYESMEEICSALQKHQSTWHQQTLNDLLTKSPTSLKVTLAQLRRGLAQDLRSCLTMESTICQHFLRHPDLKEGIRSAIIDKDRKPNWQPAKLEDVSEQDVAGFFLEMYPDQRRSCDLKYSESKAQ